MRQLLTLAFALVMLAGCGGEPQAEVSGTVTSNGSPLPEGEIIFEAADGSTTPAAGPIRNGAYSVTVAPGTKRVKITASRPAKKPDPVLGAAAREAAIGPEFNERTRLTADLKLGSNEGVNFQVKLLP